MFTWGSKYLFTVSGLSLLGAALYGLASGGDILGVLSVGYKGGVGEHTGYAILLTIAVVTGILAVFDVIIRDGDAEAAAEAAGADHVLAVSTPRTPSFWGPLAAFGLACLVVGVVVSFAFFILGLAVLAVVALEWVVLVWSDRATGDPEVNATIRSRALGPIEIPMLAMLGIAVVIVGLSRVLLAVSAAGATAVASVVAAVVFGAAIGMAKTNASRSIIAGVVALGAIGVLAGGIVGAVVGEREIAHHDDSEVHDEGGEGEGE